MTSETPWPSLPRHARLPINRCNLPAAILGSITFQHHPIPLHIDGVEILHRDLFRRLDVIAQPANRAQYFMDYMVVKFRLESPDDIGYDPHSKIDRRAANYRKVIRGWFFNPDGREAAVLKGWVESRFGLTPRFHHRRIDTLNDESYHRFCQERAEGLYNTNALESQLDLLYTYCQYELRRQSPGETHRTLYRGSNHLARDRMEDQAQQTDQILLLNNISSFSINPERADEFGDQVIEVCVPLSKIVVSSALLPGLLKGEEEILVLGGLYTVKNHDLLPSSQTRIPS
ncbi:MAG: NAD(+)--dinitrogen-reductase ADP-D-ribosyltransferase [Pseudomonadota bacterium]